MLISLLALAAILFCIGLYGVIVRRNQVLILLSLVAMFQAVFINLIAFSRYGFSPSQEGEIFAILSLFVLVAMMMFGLSLLLQKGKKERKDWDKETRKAQNDSLVSLVSCLLLLTTMALGRLWF